MSTTKAIARWLVLVGMTLLSLSSAAQPVVDRTAKQPSEPSSRLYFSYVYYLGDTHDESIKAFFNGVFEQLRLEPSFAGKYTDWAFRTVPYDSDPDRLLYRDTVSILTPLKFTEFYNHYRESLVPILVAQKGPSKSPYYSAVAIASETSPNHDLSDPTVKELVMLQAGSLSGNAAPLTLLWQRGLIASPSAKAVESKGLRIKYFNTHEEIESYVRDTPDAVGFTWARNNMSGIRVLIRWGCFPQDIVCISENLMPYRARISEVMTRMASESEGSGVGPMKATLDAPPLQIRGFEPFTTEFKNSAAHVNHMRERLNRSGGVSMAVWQLLWMAAVVACATIRCVVSRKLLGDMRMLIRAREIGAIFFISVFDAAIVLTLIYLVVAKTGLLPPATQVLDESPVTGSAWFICITIAIASGTIASRMSMMKWLAVRGRKTMDAAWAKLAGITGFNKKGKRDDRG